MSAGPRPLFAPGAVLGGRFVVQDHVGSGYSGEVYAALDRDTGQRCAVKAFRPELTERLPEYITYLTHLYAMLAESPPPFLLVPMASGESDGIPWVVFPYFAGVTDLAMLIRSSAPLDPALAIRLLAQLLQALAYLHDRDIVHADLKPSNILLVPDAVPRVVLADFGMARASSAEDPILIVGTPRYMHPGLRLGESRTSDRQRVAIRLARREFGAFLDMYAVGVIAFEMLTGSADVPTWLSEASLLRQLDSSNAALHKLPTATKVKFATLLRKLISAAAGDLHQISAKDALASLEGIAADAEVASRDQARAAQLPAPIVVSDPSGGQLLARLEAIADSLRDASQAFVAHSQSLEVIPVSTGGDQFLSELSSVFRNALARTRYSWRLTAGMVGVVFVTLTSMIVASVVSVFVAEQGYWPLIFGGVGAVTVLGTLWWRPFDRMFRATILAQHIELIHAQTVATFHSTTDLETRLRAYDHAILALRSLLREHSAERTSSTALATSTNDQLQR